MSYSRTIKRVSKHTSQLVNTKEDILGISVSIGLTAAIIGMDFLFAAMVTEIFRAMSADEDPRVGEYTVSPAAMSVLLGVVWFVNYFAEFARDLVVIPVGQRAATKLAEKYVYSEMISPYLNYQQDKNMPTRYTDYFRSRYSTPMAFLLFLTKVLPTAVSSIVTSAIISAKFGYVGLGLLPFTVLYGAFSAKTTKLVTTAREKAIAENNDMFDTIEHNFTHRETIDTFNNFQNEFKKVIEGFAKMLKTETNAATIVAKLGIGQSSISALGVTGLLAYIATGAANGTLKREDFPLVFTYLVPFFIRLNGLGPGINQLIVALQDMDTAFREIDRHTNPVDKHPDVPLIRSMKDADIEFKNVTFGYKRNEPVINNLSLKIKSGDKVCLVGGSGSGKSTLAKLLIRFYDPNEGEIYINGQNILDVSLGSLRKSIGIIPQAPTIFSTSLRENLLYGRLDRVPPVTDRERESVQRELESVLRKVGLEELIPKLDDKKIGDLSGGQKQRIAIARVLLKDPKPIINITDEATSALDANNEKMVQEVMDKAFKGSTTIVVTHRLQAAKNADVIFVLDKGRLVEQGKHDELLAKGGVYAELWKKQRDQLTRTSSGTILREHGPGSPRLFRHESSRRREKTKVLFGQEYNLRSGGPIIHESDPDASHSLKHEKHKHSSRHRRSTRTEKRELDHENKFRK